MSEPPETSKIDLSDLTPAMPAPPDDIVRQEGYMRSWDDDIDLYWQVWNVDRPGRAAVALMHGYGEHSGRYHHVSSALARAGYPVMAIDARGHGRSTGPRGHVDSYSHYTRDFDHLVSEVARRFSGLDIFAFGHSNGGLITLRHALQRPSQVKGYVVTSPFCGFQVEVPPLKALAGKAMSRIWPTFTLPTELDPAAVSRLSHVVERYRDDPLVLDVATARWFTETKRAQADTLANAGDIEHPFLWLVAGADQLADPRAAEKIYHDLGSQDREFEILPDHYHEVLNEPDWEDSIKRIIEWMNRFRA